MPYHTLPLAVQGDTAGWFINTHYLLSLQCLARLAIFRPNSLTASYPTKLLRLLQWINCHSPSATWGGFSSSIWHIHPLLGDTNLWMWGRMKHFFSWFAEAKQLPRLRWADRLRGEQKTRYFGSSVGSAWRKYWWNLQTCATTVWRDRQEIWKNMGSSGATLDCWPGCHIFNADAFQEAFYGGYWHLWFQVVGWRSSHTWESGISPPDKAKVCCRKSWRLCMERMNVAQPWAFHDISLSWMVTDMQGKGVMKFAWVFANWSEVTATSKFFLPIFYNI